MLKKIISGGQTGADQGGLRAAVILDLETGGYIVRDYMTEQGPSRFLHKYGLIELQTMSYPVRTRRNVKESDATLVIGIATERGTKLTVKYCADLSKPCYYIPWTIASEKYELSVVRKDFRKWLEEHNVKTLNVAGNRESKNPGIYKFTMNFLVDSLKP